MKLLYIEDAYCKSFNATVKAVEGNNIILDESAFYPNSGGQPADTGMLIKDDGSEYKVTNVRKKDGKVIHEVDKEGIKQGDTVHGKINWDRRYLLMRYHTAAHVLSAVIHKETEALITGNQLEESKARIDFSLELFEKEKMQGYEDQANKIIKQGHEVSINSISREKAETIPALMRLAKLLPESLKTLRTIEIKDIDLQACGGCHVKNTTEIGSIKITEMKNKGANNRRIYFQVQ